MRPIKKSSTDQSVVIRIIDSTTGLPEQAVEHDTSGISLWYRREGATITAITPAALAALDTAHADGGIEHIDDGYYRLDLPDAAISTGANGVMVGGTITDMIVIGTYIPLVDYDPYDTVRMGMTALPNAAADAAGGLVVSDAGGQDIDTVFGRITADVATEAKQDIIDTNIDQIETAVITNAAGADIAADIIALKAETVLIVEDTGTTIPGTITSLQSTADDIEADTQDLQIQIGTDGAGLTDLPWNSSWDTEVQSEVMDALISIHLDHLFNAEYDPASAPGVANSYLNELVESDGGVTRFTENALEQGRGTNFAATEAKQDIMQGNVDDILEDTDTTIPGTISTMQGNVTDILADTNELQADDTPAAISAIDTKIDVIDGIVDAIVADTGTDGVVVAAASKTGYALSAAGVDGILDEVTENSITLREAVNLFLSSLTGKTSGGGTSTIVFRDTADTKDRLSITVDGSNNRTAVGTRDGS